jgi:hypothetical protein
MNDEPTTPQDDDNALDNLTTALMMRWLDDGTTPIDALLEAWNDLEQPASPDVEED